jgi:glycosyltransferase involved in cell wall biosynthesis
MKILVVQETDWITRYPHTQHHLFERLSLKGHTIKVIDYGFDWKKDPRRKTYQKREVFPHVSKIYERSGIDVIRPASLQIPILVYLSLIVSHYKEISDQIQKFNPDIIIGFGILNTFIASKLAEMSDIPFGYFWIDALDTLIPEQYFQKIGRFFERKTIKNSRLLFVTNEKLKDHLVGLGADPKKIEIISSGIDFTRFNENVNGEEIRQIYRIKKDKIILFFMGWIYHFSGIKEIAVQLADEKAKYGKTVLFVVGEGDAYEDLVTIKNMHQLDTQLILAGKQPYDMIPKFIAAADVCILPAYPDEKIMQDIVPIKIFEYMAVGKPVISTKLSGIIKEFGFNNGILYIDKPEETLTAVDELVKSDNLHEMGMKARAFVEPKDWARITDCFEKCLEDIIHVP